MTAARLQLRGISRAFPGVQALSDVSFEVNAGEVHGLVGENGAGKSTLIKIIAGALNQDAGEMMMDGRPYEPQNPSNALQAGVSTIYQEPSWLPGRNVMFNVLLGREPAKRGGLLDLSRMRSLAAGALETLHARNIPLTARAEDLLAGQRQILEIARSLVMESSLIVMDEPTAALNHEEQQALFKVIDTLRDRGVSVLYVSHRLDEIFRLADRVTVLRDGRHISTMPCRETTRDRLISDMIGREWKGAFPERNPSPGGSLIEVEGLSSREGFRNVSFCLRAGEVLGITGLAGSGKEELGRALFGAYPVSAGRIMVSGARLKPSPAHAIRAGLAYIPEDRETEGIIGELGVGRNISLPLLRGISTGFGHIRRKAEVSLADEWVKTLDIKTPGIKQQCSNLSGGNKQKVALAKWLATKARAVIFSHPTQAIDVGVKFEMYGIISELSRKGVGIILISSEMEEVMGLCHRIMVMKDGGVRAVLDAGEASPEVILRHALGQEKTEACGADA